MSALGRCIPHVRYQQTAPLNLLSIGKPAFEFCSRRCNASIAFAGGAITEGVWGLEKAVLQVFHVFQMC